MNLRKKRNQTISAIYQGHLENFLYQFYRPFQNKKLAFAVSGGMDSVALLTASLRPLQSLNTDFQVFHIHHGKQINSVGFRNQAFEFVSAFCTKHNISFQSNVPSVDLAFNFEAGESESQMRDFRFQTFEKLMGQHQVDHVLLAHHREDLLETRLIQLLRGTGVEGFISMADIQDDKYLRPLLTVPRADLKKYLEQKKQNYLEDPSNQDIKYFRNFIRQRWLPEMESYRPGSVEALARSFEILSSKLNRASEPVLSEVTEAISREDFLHFSREEKREVLLKFLKRNGVSYFSSSQIDEVIKRLDTDQRRLTFTVSSVIWVLEDKKVYIKQEF